MEQGQFAYRKKLEEARREMLDRQTEVSTPTAAQQAEVQKEGLMRPRARPQEETSGGFAGGMGGALLDTFQKKQKELAEATAAAEKARTASTSASLGDSGLGVSEGSTGRPTARPGSTTPRDMSDAEILALTLQAEAGGEGFDGMIAAGSVIMNRADSGNYGGSNVRDVIMKPGQFSAWNGVTGYAGGEGAIDMDRLKPTKAALKAAEQLLSGQYEDVTGGATHYYNPQVASPKWGGQAGQGWTDIGNHRFGKA
jgi:spore germination cell wall hydrolase CwlJ-like protein